MTMQTVFNLFNQTSVGVVVVDYHKNIQHGNVLFARLAGKPLEELIGTAVEPYFAGLKGSLEARIWEQLDHFKPWQGEVWQRQSNGSVAVFMLTINAIKDEDNVHQGYMGVYSDITSIKKTQKKLSNLATYDGLTNLPNRHLLQMRMRQAIEQAQHNNHLLAVCFVDLDFFKRINDTYGHDRGDTLILQVAQRLTQHIKSEHTLARVGGDEFVLLLPDISTVEELHQQIQILITLLAKPYHIDGMDVKVTASIGATLYPLDEAGDSNNLIAHADAAMYEAKQAGRNCYRVYEADIDLKARERHKQIDAVHQALVQNELCLYYQPKVNLRTGKVIGMEALIRWQHPTKGLLAPIHFLPIIEHSDLMVQVGEWVVEQALTDMSAWNKLGFNFVVSVNVSGRQLQQLDFADRLIEAFSRFPDIEPRQLQLELLENAILDAEHIAPMLQQLKFDFGISIALDDFGTGYSSLTYLKQLPIDTIKIDQSFIFNMLDDMEDLAIVEALASIAHIFRLDILAEGVETSDHSLILLRLGCDLVQGYGIARPMPFEATANWINAYIPDPRWSDWIGKSWNRDDFPLLIAQYDHVKWVKNIIYQVEDVNNTNELAEPVNHHDCRFGNWYRNHGKKHYGHLPEYEQIEQVHHYVHELGSRMIRLKREGKQEEALALIPELHDLKQQIIAKISALQLHS